MNKPFTILTESGYRNDRLKRGILRLGGKVLGRKIYGPMSVYYSLIRGLEEIKNSGTDVIYNVNPRTSEVHETVIALMGIDTLQYALNLKKQGKIKKLIAGPNISVPLDNEDIFFDPNIDIILVPSPRVSDYFISLDIYNSERIHIWASGVADSGLSHKSTNHRIIYKKTCPDELYIYICSELDKQGILYTTLTYGSFSYDQYQKLLDESIAMIYLQESESQGIALQEAWIKDIPTLVWDRGYRTYAGERRWESQQISCPYLTPACGITFRAENFPQQCDTFIKNINTSNPRLYCKEHLNDYISAKRLFNLI